MINGRNLRIEKMYKDREKNDCFYLQTHDIKGAKPKQLYPEQRIRGSDYDYHKTSAFNTMMEQRLVANSIISKYQKNTFDSIFGPSENTRNEYEGKRKIQEAAKKNEFQKNCIQQDERNFDDSLDIIQANYAPSTNIKDQGNLILNTDSDEINYKQKHAVKFYSPPLQIKKHAEDLPPAGALKKGRAPSNNIIYGNNPVKNYDSIFRNKNVQQPTDIKSNYMISIEKNMNLFFGIEPKRTGIEENLNKFFGANFLSQAGATKSTFEDIFTSGFKITGKKLAKKSIKENNWNKKLTTANLKNFEYAKRQKPS